MASTVVAAVAMSFAAGSWCSRAGAAGEVFGPPNLFKTLPTPFGQPNQSSKSEGSALSPLSLQSGTTSLSHSLTNRLLAPRLYLPGRLVIGSTAQFIVKGRPGCWVALAMADRNTGAKPVLGQTIHLGPDRKVVAIGKIPPTGVVTLIIDTPVEGDLIGLPLYFEAALWTKSDFSDMELAIPVASEQTTIKQGVRDNAVIMEGELSHKRGIRIVPDSSVHIPTIQGNFTNIDSGRP